MNSRGGIRVATVAVALGAAATMWLPIPAGATGMRVSVNGEWMQLPSLDATVGDAVRAAGIRLRVGQMRTVATGEPLPRRLTSPRVLLFDRRVPMARPLSNGDRIRVINGADFVEPVDEQLVPVPTTGFPDIETQIWRGGRDGLIKRRVGRFSGQPAGKQVVEQPVPAARDAGRVVLLTFDDGPDGRWTPQVLDILRAKDVKAVFCVVGVQVARYPELLRRTLAEGHTLCNHSESHDMRMNLKTAPYVTAEIEGTSNRIRAITGVSPRFYRGPGGGLSPFIISEAHRLGMRVLSWNVDPGDYRKPGAEHIRNRIVLNMTGGGVALLHDGGGDRSQTVAQLPGLIDRLRADGYSFVVP